MSTILILAAIPAACCLILVVGAWLMEHADAEQGPPPTLRPDPGFDDGLDVDDLSLLDAAELLVIETPGQIIWSRS